MDGKLLRDYLPIMLIQDGCIVSKRGDLTFGWEVTLPVAFTVSEAGYDSIIRSFVQAYKTLPVYTIVHKQDVYRYDVYHSEEVGEFLGDCYERHFEGRKYINGYCYLYVTFSTKSNVDSKSASSGLFGGGSSKVPDEGLVEFCASKASAFEAVLGNNPLLRMRPLRTSDLVRVGDCGESLGVVADYLRFYGDERNVDFPLEFSPDKIKCGGVVARAWYVQDSDAYPGVVSSVAVNSSRSSVSSRVYLSGGSPLGYSLSIPHVVNRYVVRLPERAVEAELSQKKKFMNSFSLYSSSCRVNARELQAYLDDAANGDGITVKCFTDVIAWFSPEGEREARNKIFAAFSDLGVTVTEETRLMPLLHYAGIPGAESNLGSDFFMTGEMVSFLCHGLWDGYDGGVSGGCIKLCDRNRHVPVRIDIQSVAREKGLIDNMNAIVVGPSGSGKSFLTNALVRNYYDSGQHIMIIDVGDSYEGLCRVIREETGGKDGVYNAYDPDKPFRFNPFFGRRHWGELDEDGERKGSGLDFFLSLVQTMYEPKGDGWTKERTGVLANIVGQFFALWDGGCDDGLEDALLEAYVNSRRARAEKRRAAFDERGAAKGYISPLKEVFPAGRAGKDPLFDNFYRYVTLVVSPLMRDENYFADDVPVTKEMFDVDSFAVALGKYKIGGEYGFLLNAETQDDLFSSRLTVFEVDKIKGNDDLFPLWLLCILHSFEEKMRSLPCQKVMVIEEAWSAIAKPAMANFIVWLWRTARKFRASAVVVTQSLSDLVSSDIIKDAIILNSSVKILLDQSRNAGVFQKSADMLAFTPNDVSSVLSVGRSLDPRFRYKEAFFSVGSRGGVYAVEVSEEEALVYESDKTKKKPLFDLAEEKGSMIEAVREMAEERRRAGKA